MALNPTDAASYGDSERLFFFKFSRETEKHPRNAFTSRETLEKQTEKHLPEGLLGNIVLLF